VPSPAVPSTEPSDSKERKRKKRKKSKKSKKGPYDSVRNEGVHSEKQEQEREEKLRAAIED
jgi:hypothetical protein